MIDITKYIIGYKKLKNDKLPFEKILKILEETFKENYQAICLDIDKTITNNQKIDNEMLEIFEQLIKKNVSICFVTGRGRKSSKEILLQVYKHMKENQISIKNITCATNNGVIFLNTNKDFLDTERNIVSKIKIEEYLYLKNKIREKYIEEIVKLGCVNANKKEITTRSLYCTGKASLRFAFKPNEILNNEVMINSLKEIINKTDLAEELNVFKGKHKDKIIYEVSLADKIKAVEYFAKTYNIAIDKIVKIGDQASQYGNDYTMLKSKAGFSVDEIDRNTIEILPVINNKGEQEKGIKATKKIIKELKFVDIER